MKSSVNYMGLSLKNPVIAASGPWSRNAEGIQKAIDAGASAVVTETISLESSAELCPRVYNNRGNLLNTTLYSPVFFEQWEEEMGKIQKNGSYVIANIRGGTPSEFAYIASRLERWDVDALELTPFTPIGVHIEGADSDPQKVVEIIDAVVSSVSIPVSIRLPYYLAERTNYIHALENAGIQGIGTTESIKALWNVDIEKRKSTVPTFGGYTGAYLKPIMLAAVSSLAQIAESDISAIGGIQSSENILEAILMGASTVQIGSAIMLHGYGFLSALLKELKGLMEKYGYDSFDSIRGSALNSIRAFEDLSFVRRKALLKTDAVFTDSMLKEVSSSCLYGAIQSENNRPVILEHCTGCGLCASLMPEIFQMG